jgi:HSP20 family protein
MAETKVPVTKESKPAASPTAMQAWRPFESLRREVDRLFEDFTMNPFRLPFRRPAFDIEPFWQAESWISRRRLSTWSSRRRRSS